MRSNTALAVILATLLCMALAACGGTKTLVGSPAAVETQRGASYAGASEWYMEGGGRQHSRDVWYQAGPRRSTLEWSSYISGLQHNGCREFAIDQDGTLYVHNGIPSIGAVNGETGALMYSKTNLPGGTPSSRWQSTIAILQDGYICHVEPVDSPTATCQLVVYQDDRPNRQFVEADRVTIGGSVAYSPCVVDEGGYSSIYVVTDTSPMYLYKFHYANGNLTLDWNAPKQLYYGVQPTPPIFVDGEVLVATQNTFSPNTVYIYRYTASGSLQPGDMIPVGGEMLNEAGLTADYHGNFLFTTINPGFHGTLYLTDKASWTALAVDPAALVPGAIAITAPAISHDDPYPGSDSAYVGVATATGTVLLGVDCDSGAMNYKSEEVGSRLDLDYPETNLAIDGERKVYLPCVAALYCFEPHPLNFPGSRLTPVWWKDLSSLTSEQVFSAHIGPGGRVYAATVGGANQSHLVCFGPGNNPVVYTPRWEQWGNGFENARAGTATEYTYRGPLNLSYWYEWPALNATRLCSSPVSAGAIGVGGTADMEYVWANDELGGIHGFLNLGMTLPRIWSYAPPGPVIPNSQFASPTIQQDGRVVYVANGATLVGVEDGTQGPGWDAPLGSSQFTSPCVVHDPAYGGMRVYVGGNLGSNNYTLRCYLDDGTLVWSQPALPGTLLGTPALVENEISGRTIFVTVLQNPQSYPNLYDVLGYDADSGALVYEALNLLGNWGPPYPPTEYSILCTGSVPPALVVTTPRWLHGLSVPPRGGGVTPLNMMWSTQNPYFITIGSCMFCNLAYITTSCPSGTYCSFAIDALSGTVIAASLPALSYRTASRPVVDDVGTLYVAGQDNLLVYDYNLALLQDLPLQAPVNGSPALGGLGVYISTEAPGNPNNSRLCFISN